MLMKKVVLISVASSIMATSAYAAEEKPQNKLSGWMGAQFEHSGTSPTHKQRCAALGNCVKHPFYGKKSHVIDETTERVKLPCVFPIR